MSGHDEHSLALSQETLGQEERERLRDLFEASGAASEKWQLRTLVQQATGIAVDDGTLTKLAADVRHSFTSGSVLSCEQFLALMASLKLCRIQEAPAAEREEEDSVFTAFFELAGATVMQSTGPPPRSPDSPRRRDREDTRPTTPSECIPTRVVKRKALARHLAEFGIDGTVLAAPVRPRRRSTRNPRGRGAGRMTSNDGGDEEHLGRNDFRRLLQVIQPKRRLSQNMRTLREVSSAAGRRSSSINRLECSMVEDADSEPQTPRDVVQRRVGGRGTTALRDAFRQGMHLLSGVRKLQEAEAVEDETSAVTLAQERLARSTTKHDHLLRWGDPLWKSRPPGPQYLDHRYVHRGEVYTHERATGDPLWLYKYRDSGGVRRSSTPPTDQQAGALLPDSSPRSRRRRRQAPHSPWRVARRWRSLQRPAPELAQRTRDDRKWCVPPPPGTAEQVQSAMPAGAAVALCKDAESSFAAARRILNSRLEQGLPWTAQERLLQSV